MPAHISENGADVEATTTANTVQRIPLLGISQSASSGPSLVRFSKPTNLVKKLSALRTLVASQVFLVALITGTLNTLIPTDRRGLQ